MRARALQSWISRLHGDAVEVRRWQALEEGSRLDRFGVGLYNTIQRRAPWAHHLYFNFLEQAALHRSAGRLRGQAPFTELLRSFVPEVIISVHAHLNHGHFEWARQILGPDVRLMTYCGELYGGYGFSRHWVNPAADRFIAAVDPCAQAAIAHGMAADKTTVGGFLLDPAFFDDGDTATTSAAALRNSFFGNDSEQPTLLLGTGSNGANNHLPVLRALARLRQPMNVLALCGRNETIRRRIETLAPQLQPLHIVASGYRTDMHQLLKAVDCAFIRPGTGTTSECIISRCPVIFNGVGGVMPQEGITVKFMRALGIDAPVARNANALARIVNERLSHDFRRDASSRREQLQPINNGLHPANIVREILA